MTSHAPKTDLFPGAIVRCGNGPTVYIITVRKETDDGWWLTRKDGRPAGGFADYVLVQYGFEVLNPQDAPDYSEEYVW